MRKMHLIGEIVSYSDSHVMIMARIDNSDFLKYKAPQTCEITIDDGRNISSFQRNKIYATIKEIATHSGFTPESAKELLKDEFCAKSGVSMFSLADTDMTTANDFLQYLIDFCIEQDVPTKASLLESSPDVAKYIYKCLCEKKCCISRKKAELHHVDVVGLRNRKKTIHKGMRVMPLSREFHTEAHALGQQTFNEKYHVFGITLDNKLCDIWNLRKD